MGPSSHGSCKQALKPPEFRNLGYTDRARLDCNHEDKKIMDPEEQTQLLAPTHEQLASVKVFPLIPYLKHDAIVSPRALRIFANVMNTRHR